MMLSPVMAITEAWSQQCPTKTYYYKSNCGGGADPGYNYLGVPLVPGRSSLSSATQACESDAKASLTRNWVNKSSTYAIYKIANITSVTPWNSPRAKYVSVDGKYYSAIVDFTNVYTWASGEFLPPRFPNGGTWCNGTSCVSKQFWDKWVPSGGPVQSVTWQGCPPFEDPDNKKYTIKLSPVTANAYGNYLTSINPKGTSKLIKVKLIAEVTDQDGQYVNAAIKLKVTAIDGSGGHVNFHIDRNPLKSGKLKVGSLNSHTINIAKSGMVNGVVEFEFYSTDVSGDHKIEASCTDISCEQTGKDAVWVGVKDLNPLPASSSYVFIGQTRHHPDNHFATDRVIEKIQSIAQDYHAWFPNDDVLHINDISLEQGGLFDAKSDGDPLKPPSMAKWKRPNSLHRTGEDIDIRAHEFLGTPGGDVPLDNYIDFHHIARANGCTAGVHAASTSGEHFHLYCSSKHGK